MTGALSGPWCDGHALACRIYGPPGCQHPELFARADLPENSGLTAFAYLWRRFGPPWYGSDAYKDLAGYILGTPHPDVFLRIALKGSGLEYGTGYLITQTFEATLLKAEESAAWEKTFEAWWLDKKLTEDEAAILEQALPKDHPDYQAVVKHYWDDRLNSTIVREAEGVLGVYPGRACRDECPLIVDNITAALQELLRPVYIRDVYFNILGRVRDEDLSDDWASAEPSKYAGLGMPQDAVEALLHEEDED